MKNADKNRKSGREKSKRGNTLPKKPILRDLHSDTRKIISALILGTLAVLTGLALLNMAGPLGRGIITLIRMLFGVVGYLLPLVLAFASYLIIHTEKTELAISDENKPSHSSGRVLLGIAVTWLGVAGLLHLAVSGTKEELWLNASAGTGGGYVGGLTAYIFFATLGKWASGLTLSAISAIGLIIASNWAPQKKPIAEGAIVPPSAEPSAGFLTSKIKSVAQNLKTETLVGTELSKEESSKPKPSTNANKGDEIGGLQMNTKISLNEDWQMPPFDLLESKTAKADYGNVEAGSAIIQQTLKNFGIDVEMGEINQGPTVTQYTLRPATGVKLSQINALRQDMALALAAKSLRMELPIPGKALVGVEVPNRTSALVTLRSILETPEFINSKSPLSFALGADVAGRPQIGELTKLPHMLIAGATGSGKSVAINTFLISLLYRNSPRMVKLILIDPKRVELTLYQGLPHLLTAPITEPDKAVNALRWAVAEMDRRYKELQKAGKRNIAEYNAVAGEPLPYIVVIVDEMADIMAVAGKDMESAVARLAQMARAIGIHLVLATQRPSVDILTGLIKANITARMAFAVASQIDSRTILDNSGAEQLLGNGDMLFISADQAKPRRIQSPYIGETEIRKVVDFCKRQVGAVIYDDTVIEKKSNGAGLAGAGEDFAGEDALLEQAKEEILRANKASASLLQRRLRIGYSRAARLIDLLEASGVVGPQDGARPREVYGDGANLLPVNELDEDIPQHHEDPKD